MVRHPLTCAAGPASVDPPSPLALEPNHRASALSGRAMGQVFTMIILCTAAPEDSFGGPCRLSIRLGRLVAGSGHRAWGSESLRILIDRTHCRRERCNSDASCKRS
jgi:hypothetical protein